jgi:hypothetical protein
MKAGRIARVITLGASISTFLLATAVAQETGFATKGIIEVSGSVSYSNYTNVTRGTASSNSMSFFSFGPKISYFIVNGFELGFDPGIAILGFLPGLSFETSSGSSTTTLTQLFVAPAYNFRSEGSRVVPFIEVPVGYTSISGSGSSASGLSWGVRAGIKTIASSHFLITFFGEYFQMTFTPQGQSDREGFNFLSFGIGVGGFF